MCIETRNKIKTPGLGICVLHVSCTQWFTEYGTSLSHSEELVESTTFLYYVKIESFPGTNIALDKAKDVCIYRFVLHHEEPFNGKIWMGDRKDLAWKWFKASADTARTANRNVKYFRSALVRTELRSRRKLILLFPSWSWILFICGITACNPLPFPIMPVDFESTNTNPALCSLARRLALSDWN